jgi:DNA-binding NtrC family response regulator
MLKHDRGCEFLLTAQCAAAQAFRFVADLARTTDAYEALEFLDENDISVALLDIRMYPIDGVALLAEIKKRSPSTHVIMMTSRPTAETQSSCIQNGAIDYFTKPLDIQKLKIALRGLVG